MYIYMMYRCICSVYIHMATETQQSENGLALKDLKMLYKNTIKAP